MKKYPAIMSSLYNREHCILPEKLLEIESFIQMRQAGHSIEFDGAEQPGTVCIDLDGEMGAAQERLRTGSTTSSFVAVLPLFGTMFQHGGIEMQASGGTSTAQFSDQFTALDNNPAVKTVVIEAHTPGGEVFGTGELSDLIYNARQRGRTRVVTIGNSMVASAGLWVGTAASEFHLTPGGQAGSLGVVTMHQDVSELEAKEGIKTTILAVPEAKVEGHEYAPLPDDVKQKILGKVGKTYERFVGAVARNRGVSAEKAISDFGGGDMLRADEALAAGLIDGVMTKAEVLDQELIRLKSGSKQGNSNRLALAEG